MAFRPNPSNAPTSGIHFEDDEVLAFGNTIASPNVSIVWETADANANALLVALPEGGATDVPVFIIGDQTALNTDLEFFNGITAPSLAVLSSDATKYLRIYNDGSHSYFDANSGSIFFQDTVGINGGIFQCSAATTAQFLGASVSFDFNGVTGGITYFGTSNDTGVGWNTAQTPDTLVWGLSGAASSNTIVFCEIADDGFDFAHAAQTNPTVYIHSASQSTTQWIGLTHDQTNAVITSGAGDIYLNPASSVRFGTHTALGAETVTGYVTINDSGGTPRKLAVVS